jgi:hypothetical protein
MAFILPVRGGDSSKRSGNFGSRLAAELAMMWFFSGLAQAELLGVVTALVYKPMLTETRRNA